MKRHRHNLTNCPVLSTVAAGQVQLISRYNGIYCGAVPQHCVENDIPGNNTIGNTRHWPPMEKNPLRIFHNNWIVIQVMSIPVRKQHTSYLYPVATAAACSKVVLLLSFMYCLLLL